MSSTTARSFTRANEDLIQMSRDSFPQLEPITFAAIVRKTSDVIGVPIALAAGTTADRMMQSRATGSTSVTYWDQAVGGAGGVESATKAIPLNSWALIIASRDSSNSSFSSIYDFTADTWTHATPATFSAGTAKATDIVIGCPRTDGGPSSAWEGQIAVAGMTATVLNQTQRQSMVSGGLSTLDLWTAAGFTSANSAKVFVLDQAAITTAVTDAVGGSTQVAISGTAVYTGVVPFERSTGSPPPPTSLPVDYSDWSNPAVQMTSGLSPGDLPLSGPSVGPRTISTARAIEESGPRTLVRAPSIRAPVQPAFPEDTSPLVAARNRLYQRLLPLWGISDIPTTTFGLYDSATYDNNAYK